MRGLVAALVVALAAAACSGPQEGAREQVADAGRTEIDVLLARLQSANDAGEAERLESMIIASWAHSGDPAIDALTVEAIGALHRGEIPIAVAIFDRIVDMAPHFADGWRWRGTAHYLAEDHGAALGDLFHALALEPRHFGALSTLARVLTALHEYDAAIRAYEMALEVNPHLDFARQRLGQLREKAAGIPV